MNVFFRIKKELSQAASLKKPLLLLKITLCKKYNDKLRYN
ncbi:hypothetical protein HMPREF0556_10464 [Listeria grayi DSM 20601]|uniref:Uncharacterized protein n=1 Tax=Listeria grayi DSM 20601 TaxID=525367 RepID=D7UUF8_LISGR|nr:hypothetical protein HMPREF0556_10464 [Listeria grayi DSM 20601]